MLKRRLSVALFAVVSGFCLFTFQNCSQVNDLSQGAYGAGGGVNSKLSQVETSSVVVSVNGPSAVSAGQPARFVASAIDAGGNSIVYDWYINGELVGDRSNVLNVANVGIDTQVVVIATSPVTAESATASLHVTVTN